MKKNYHLILMHELFEYKTGNSKIVRFPSKRWCYGGAPPCRKIPLEARNAIQQHLTLLVQSAAAEKHGVIMIIIIQVSGRS